LTSSANDGEGYGSEKDRRTHFSGEWEMAQDGTYVNHDNPNPDDSYAPRYSILSLAHSPVI
jgi:hypothetical protein